MATFGFEKIKSKSHMISAAIPTPLADVMRMLSPNFNEKIWLVGGTALSAYYFGHRRSDDLDLFVVDEVSLNIAVAAVRALVKKGLVLKDESRTPLYYHANANYSGHTFTVDVVLDENLHKVGRATPTDDGLWIADLDTLFAMKAACLVSRASEKDLFDLDHMLGLLGHWDVTLLVSAGRAMDAGMDVETLLISLKGALLRKEACGFLLPGSKLKRDQVFHAITSLRDTLVAALVEYARKQPETELVQTLKASVKDFKG